MKKVGTGAGSPADAAIRRWLSQPEADKLAAEISLQDQEFRQIMEVAWPAGFPEAETGSPAPATAESHSGAEVPEEPPCKTPEDYEARECAAWQRYEEVVAPFWSNYLRISESAWQRHCSIEQAVWRLYGESIEPARLKLKEAECSAYARKDRAALLAARVEYAETTRPATEWRMETLQAAREEYERIIRNARSEYDRVEAVAKKAYDDTLGKLRRSLKLSAAQKS